jgi:hypothetical protein
MKYLFSFIFMFTLSALSFAQVREINNKATDKHVFLPGSHVALEQMENKEFTISPLPRGFFNKAKTMGVSVVELTGNFDINEEEDRTKILKLGRIFNYDRYIMNGMPARYKMYEIEGEVIVGTGEKPNSVLVMNLEIKGNENKIYSITAIAHASQAEKHRKAFERCMFSAVIDEDRKIDDADALPFSIDYSNTILKPENAPEGGFALTPEGKRGEENAEGTRLSIEYASLKLEGDELRKYFDATFANAIENNQIKLGEIKDAHFGNLEGFEASGFKITPLGEFPFYAAIVSKDDVLLTIQGESKDEGQLHQAQLVLQTLKAKKIQ